MFKFSSAKFLFIIIGIFLIIVCLNNCSSPDKKNISRQAAEINTTSNPVNTEFEITKIERNGKFFAVELNKNIAINGITIKNNDIVFPMRKSRKSDKELLFLLADNNKTDIFLNRLKNEILKFNTDNKSTFSNIQKKLEIGAIDVRLYENDKSSKNNSVKAFINLVSKEGLIFSGILVKLAKNGLEVQWPILDTKSKIEIFSFNDKQNRAEINEKIIARFIEKAAVENYNYLETNQKPAPAVKSQTKKSKKIKRSKS